MKDSRTICFESARRVVVKVGSNVLTADNDLNLAAIRSISRQICTLIRAGLEVILVSSGAMAAGLRKLDLARRPEEVPKRQAVAAVGQADLIRAYEKAFARQGKKVAQILLTSDDLSNRRRYLNARNTLNTLLDWRVVPIINENDTVMVEEIKFGDNDTLAAMITLLMDADLLVNLTDIDGLYTRDPRRFADAELIPVIARIEKRIEKFAGDIPGALGTGGMLSKIKAARKLGAVGIPMVIANGTRPDILGKLFDGRNLGTFFVPRQKKLSKRKGWIAFNLKPQGSLVIDGGAIDALLRNGKSLLPSGIVAVEGEFAVGAAVTLKGATNETVAIGLVNYGSEDIEKIKGRRSGQIKNCLGHKPYDEVIHRDNLTITVEMAD